MTQPSPEALINKVVAADALRRQHLGIRPAAFDPRQKIWIEPFFNVLGMIWGRATSWIPWSFRKPYVQWIVKTMGGHDREINPQLPALAKETVELARSVYAKTGRWPALLVTLSHPATEGPLQWLRFELLCQALVVANAVVDARRPWRFWKRHPRCMLAIDPFALDTVSSAVGGFYAAWMHQYNFAYDRQTSMQSWTQRCFFLRHSGYARAGWRILKYLNEDVPVLMALGGGLPYNARLLYAAREFVQRLKMPPNGISKRTAQLELMDILMTPSNGVWPAEKGELLPDKKKNIEDALSRWGLPEAPRADALNAFVEEFREPVPYRERLFRILERRLLMRGKPLIVLPFSHEDTAPHIRLGKPRLLEKSSGDVRSFGKILAPFFRGKI